jgi:uncharacterized BrkB/YihY/UPF0761 family membrane protein
VTNPTLSDRLAARFAPLLGWWEQSLVAAVLARLEPARPQVLASAIGYNLFFALVPTAVAMAALISLVGRDQGSLDQLEEVLSPVLPPSIVAFVSSIITQVESSLGDATITVVVIALLVALWSGARASDILIAALASIEGRAELRPWVARRAIGMLATAGIALSLLTAGLLLTAGEAIAGFLDEVGLERVADALLLFRVPVAGIVIGSFLWLFYRQAPPEPFPRSLLAAICSMLGIAAASVGLRMAAGFGFGASPTFAVLGSVALLMLWLYVIGYVLVGSAALAATLEDRLG